MEEGSAPSMFSLRTARSSANRRWRGKSGRYVRRPRLRPPPPGSPGPPARPGCLASGDSPVHPWLGGPTGPTNSLCCGLSSLSASPLTLNDGDGSPPLPSLFASVSARLEEALLAFLQMQQESHRCCRFEGGIDRPTKSFFQGGRGKKEGLWPTAFRDEKRRERRSMWSGEKKKGREKERERERERES